VSITSDTGVRTTSETFSSTDTTPPTSQDTGTSAAFDAPQISAVTARLHETFGTLVYVEWDQLEAATVYVEFSFDDDDWRSTPAVAASPGAQSHLLLGAPHDSAVRYRVVNDFGSGPLVADEQVISTDVAPEDMPRVQLVSGDEARWDPESAYLFLSISEPGRGTQAIGEDWWVLILDRLGRVVWARETPNATSFHPRVSYDGTDLFVDQSTVYSLWDSGAASTILRMKIDGTIVDTYATPGLHHPYTDTADGSLVWAATGRGGNETLEKLPAGGGEQVQVWDCLEHLQPIDLRASCGSNTLSWVEETDSFLFSLYSEHTIFEISHATGEVARSFGQFPGSWRFVPDDVTFYWQHGGHYTDAGTLIVSTSESTAESAMVLREFSLDEETETITEIWNLGVGAGLDNLYMGEPHRLSNGNTLQNAGAIPMMREATPAGEIVWEVSWEIDHWLGRSTPVSDLYLFLE